jgi:hypothetical protein
MMDYFDGRAERFSPAVAGHEKILRAAAVFEPISLSRVRHDAKKSLGEERNIPDSPPPVGLRK